MIKYSVNHKKKKISKKKTQITIFPFNNKKKTNQLSSLDMSVNNSGQNSSYFLSIEEYLNEYSAQLDLD